MEAETTDNEVELIVHCSRRVPHGDENESPIELDEYKKTMKHIAFLLCEYLGASEEENPFYRTVNTLTIMPSRNNSRTTVCDYVHDDDCDIDPETVTPYVQPGDIKYSCFPIDEMVFLLLIIIYNSL